MASAAFCALLIAHISETDGTPASATRNNAEVAFADADADAGRRGSPTPAMLAHLGLKMDVFQQAVLQNLHNASLLRQEVLNFYRFNFKEQRFLTIGLEASGHQLFETLPIKGYENPGGQASFSANGFERKNRNTNQRNMAVNGLRMWYYPKYLVLIRNPLQHFESFLHRYWRSKYESLSLVYDSWISSATQMQILVHSLIAYRKPMMVVPYEDLCINPSTYKTALAHFLDIHMKKEDLEIWMSQIRIPKTYNIENKLNDSTWGRWSGGGQTHSDFVRVFYTAFRSTNLYDVFSDMW